MTLGADLPAVAGVTGSSRERPGTESRGNIPERSSQSLELVSIEACLPQYAPEGANGNLSVPRNNGRADTFASVPDKLDMTSPLADLLETCRFQPTFNLAVG